MAFAQNHMPRAAGVLIPLFSLRTRDDLGRGDILDLVPFFDFALAMRHRVIQLLPLGETAPGEKSPYNALSVFAIDPLYISLRRSDGVSTAELERAREMVGQRRLVPCDRIRAARMPLLQRAFENFATRGSRLEHEQFQSFVEQHRGWLDDYALFRALKERFQWASWEQWPDELRWCDQSAVAAARLELDQAVMMYSYWQFLAHRQWAQVRDAAISRGVMLGGDLSFSPARDSAEVWANQELFRLDRSVGTPPDAFSAKGQQWGLPMPDWERMRADGFCWWRQRVRDARALYDLFRIDHVVGLYRTFSFGSDPDEPGVYWPETTFAQREQGEAFMRMVIEEAGNAFVIAEDLGSVPAWVRKSLAALRIPGFKVVRWEKEENDDESERSRFVPPAEYPELSVATTSTHDTETFTVWWRDVELAERESLAEALALQGVLDPRSTCVKPQALEAMIEKIYESPARLALLPIQDLFGWHARINLPGSLRDSNWTYRLPLPLERLAVSPPIRKRLDSLRAIVERTHR